MFARRSQPILIALMLCSLLHGKASACQPLSKLPNGLQIRSGDIVVFRHSEKTGSKTEDPLTEWGWNYASMELKNVLKEKVFGNLPPKASPYFAIDKKRVCETAVAAAGEVQSQAKARCGKNERWQSGRYLAVPRPTIGSEGQITIDTLMVPENERERTLVLIVDSHWINILVGGDRRGFACGEGALLRRITEGAEIRYRCKARFFAGEWLGSGPPMPRWMTSEKDKSLCRGAALNVR